MNQDLLIELGTEELPPKALQQLADAFASDIINSLAGANLSHQGYEVFATPRRLALVVKQLATVQADQQKEKRGPAVKAAFDADGKPTKAAEGFARGCGVSADQLQTIKTDKGEWLAYTLTEKGKSVAELIEGFIEQSLHRLPIPKRMRWGSSRNQFVRPVHWLVVMQGDRVIPCQILGLTSGQTSYGHRFMGDGAITIEQPARYAEQLLEQGKVMVSFAERKAVIEQQALELAKTVNGQACIDADLLDEVTGLVEWPVPLMGNFEDSFLSVPQEALIYAMQDHQKYFPVLDADGKLMPYFITVSNILSSAPEKVISGNERVIRPRLADAAFFFETDKKKTLAQHNQLNERAVFQAKLGSVAEKAQRIAELVQAIATLIGGDSEKAKQAGELAKADLTTYMVGEFASMQGSMGFYLAKHEGFDNETALALKEQYLPRFATDQLPTTNTGVALALADRLDTLVGIFGIGLKPTGDKDPYALRRATIGILRILIEKQLAVDLQPLIAQSIELYGNRLDNDSVQADVQAFIVNRYRAFYQEQGIPTNTILAVQEVATLVPWDFQQRIEAVSRFTRLEEADSLAAANKRVRNILAKQGDDWVIASFNPDLLQDDAEIALTKQLDETEHHVKPLLASGDYQQALTQMASLRHPVDKFFDDVMVMSDDLVVRENRLALLNRLRALFLQVADISQLQS